MTPSFERSTALQARLHEVVPGGAHTFAKGSDQYPEGMAPVLVRGHGARVWDVDGNEFVEYGMGMRAVTLGHGYAPVLDAVRAALARRRVVHPPDGARAGRRGGLPPGRARRGHGEVLQERLRRHERRPAAGPRRDRPRGRGDVPRPAVLRLAGLVRRHPADEHRGARGGAVARADLPLQRPGGAAGGPGGRAGGVRDPRGGDGAGRAGPGVPGGRACAVRPARHGADPRRDDHGFPLVGGWGAVGVRGDTGPVDLGQGDGQRVLGRGAGGAARPDGARRPAHRPPAGVPPVEHERRRDDGAGGVPRGRAGLHGSVAGARSGRGDGAAGPGPGRGGQRRRGRGRDRGVPVGARPPVVPDLPHRGRDGGTVAGDAHPVPAGDPAPRRARPVVRDLRRAHRRRRGADRRGRPRGHRDLPQGPGDRAARGAVHRPAGRARAPAHGRAPAAGPDRPGRPAGPLGGGPHDLTPGRPVRPLPASPR